MNTMQNYGQAKPYPNLNEPLAFPIASGPLGGSRDIIWNRVDSTLTATHATQLEGEIVQSVLHFMNHEPSASISALNDALATWIEVDTRDMSDPQQRQELYRLQGIINFLGELMQLNYNLTQYRILLEVSLGRPANVNSGN